MKIFCIGFNKTGTTSLAKLFTDEKFNVAPQYIFEKCLHLYTTNKFNKIIDLIENEYNNYNFFQDVPFSLPNFYLSLYERFPNAKYILSVRNSSEDWYNSLIRFANLTINKNKIPLFAAKPIENTNLSNEEKINFLQEKMYREIWTNNAVNQDKEILINEYEKHNADVKNFFKNKKNFIEINLSNSEDFLKLKQFINIKFKSEKFPHENKTKEG